jgi:RND family efflux transporter MFP subunit
MAKEREKTEEIKVNIFRRVLNFVLGHKKMAALIVVILLGILGWRYYSAQNNNNAETVEVKRGTVNEELILSGEIDADEYAELAFSSSGKITWVGVSEGDWAKKGQALVKIDTTKLNADLQRARADLREEEASVDKAHDDVKDHDDDETYTQRETRTIAEVAKDKAWEAVIKAEEDLKNATLLAPFAGLVTSVTNPYSGVNVLYTATQVELINPETIFFDVSADQSEVTNLSLGQKVNVVMDSFAGEELEGEVVFIGYTPKAGETGAVYKVKVGFKSNEDTKKLRIGMTGDAKFILSEKTDVLYVPPSFVNSDTKGKYVRLGKKNNKVYIDVGIEGEERVEVSGDVSEGDIIFD